MLSAQMFVPDRAPSRPDITRDVDGVISGCWSMSYAAPHLFGDRLMPSSPICADAHGEDSHGRLWD
jgi:hypothetical protein